jgi:hypothetical protein
VLPCWKFPEPKGRAWLKHSIEEMGSLENFLPEFYAREARGNRVRDAARWLANDTAMTSSSRIARLVGPTLIVPCGFSSGRSK